LDGRKPKFAVPDRGGQGGPHARWRRLGDLLAPAQVLVHEPDGDRAFANGRRDPLHGPVPHVARGEHARHAGLERPWAAPFRSGHVLTGEDESPLVALHGAREPSALWKRADEHQRTSVKARPY
jgi:hypothetical protein